MNPRIFRLKSSWLAAGVRLTLARGGWVVGDEFPMLLVCVVGANRATLLHQLHSPVYTSLRFLEEIS